jgi:hypothetical protein
MFLEHDDEADAETVKAGVAHGTDWPAQWLTFRIGQAPSRHLDRSEPSSHERSRRLERRFPTSTVSLHCPASKSERSRDLEGKADSPSSCRLSKTDSRG